MRTHCLVTLITYGILPATALAGLISIADADAAKVDDVLNITSGPNSETSLTISSAESCPGLWYNKYPVSTVGQYGTYCPNGEWTPLGLITGTCYGDQCKKRSHEEIVQYCVANSYKSVNNWGTPRALCSVWANYVIAGRDNKPYTAPNCPAVRYNGTELDYSVDRVCPNGDFERWFTINFDCYVYTGTCEVPSRTDLINTCLSWGEAGRDKTKYQNFCDKLDDWIIETFQG